MKGTETLFSSAFFDTIYVYIWTDLYFMYFTFSVVSTPFDVLKYKKENNKLD